jgi:hypothetical protein
MKKIFAIFGILLASCMSREEMVAKYEEETRLRKEKEERELKGAIDKGIAAPVDCELDEFRKTTYCYAGTMPMPTYDSYGRLDGGYSFSISSYKLIFAENDSLKNIYFSFTYKSEDWAFINSALDIDGNRLKFTQKNRQVLPRLGYVQENFLIEVEKDYLKKHIANGIKIKLIGDKREIVLDIPSGYIKAFLSWIDTKKP